MGPGIARERETSADYAALYRRERRTLSQSRMERPLTASSSEARRAAVVLGARLRRAERGGGRNRGRAAGHAGRQGALPGIATSGGGGSTHDGGGLGRKLCLRFLILTAARSGEARGATWAEIDLEAREWRIPGARMKKGREHRVPLSDAAAAALERARGLDDGSGLVFLSPLRPGRPSPR